MHLRHLRARLPRTRRTVTVIGLAGAALLLGAGTAFAHVTVNPNSAAVGSFTTLTFRVPTESDTASTTKLEIDIPADTPLPYVLAEHTPGWTAELITTDLPKPVTQGTITLTKAITKVTFTATDGGIKPDEFATLDLLVGPLPDVPSITFAAIQTYSDGSVVSWNEPTPAGGEEPEHPAPVLTIGPAAAGSTDDDHMSMATTTTGAGAATDTGSGPQAATTSHESDTVARWLGGAGLLAGLAAVGIAVSGRRRPASPSGSSSQSGPGKTGGTVD